MNKAILLCIIISTSLKGSLAEKINTYKQQLALLRSTIIKTNSIEIERKKGEKLKINVDCTNWCDFECQNCDY